MATGTYDPNTRFASRPVSVPPSPATSGPTLICDVHADDPFAGLLAPYYALIRPGELTAHDQNAETPLVTAAVAGTRTGSILITVLQDGSPGQGSATIDTVVQGGGGTNEQQSIVIQADGGTYPLTFKGASTAGLAHNANDAAKAAALNALATIASYASATITEVQAGGPATNAQQQITIVASGGTLTYALEGDVTGPIAWNASDATIKTALEGLASVGAGNVNVVGGLVTFQGDLALTAIAKLVLGTGSLTGTGSVTVSGGVVTFGGGLMANQDVPELSADSSSLTYTANGQNEKVLIAVAADSGTETFTFGGNTTAATNWNAAASTVKTRLEALASIGAGNVDVTGDAGGPYTVEFKSAKGNQNLGAITADASALTLNIRTFTLLRAQKGSTARAVVAGDAFAAAALPDLTFIAPAALAGTVNDYNPAGLAAATILALQDSGAGTSVLTGLAGGSPGREILILNVGALAITAAKLDTGSAAANRFALPGVPGDLELAQFDALRLVHDGTNWKAQGATVDGSIDGPFYLNAVVQEGYTGTINNYDPDAALGGSAVASIVVAAGALNGADRDLTGILAPDNTFGNAGRVLLIANQDGANALTLKDESASSAAANRLALAADVRLPGNGAGAIVYYNQTLARWSLIASHNGETATTSAFAFFLGG